GPLTGAADGAVAGVGPLRGAGRFVEGAAAAGVVPARFGERRPADVREGGGADGDDAGGRRRVAGPGAGAVVARGDEDADAGPGEVGVVGPLAGELGDAEAVGDVAGVAGGVVLGRDHVGQPVASGFDEEDPGPRGDGVDPLDVHRDLHRPLLVG